MSITASTTRYIYTIEEHPDNVAPIGFVEGGAIDSIYGGAGNDEITSLSGYIALFGGEGENTLTGSDTRDTIIGALGGIDYIVANGGDDSISASEQDTVFAGNGNDTVEVYNLFGGIVDSGSGNDSVTAEGDDLTIDLGTGSDTFRGLLESSSVNGGTGNDELEVYLFNSQVDGGSGEDWIYIGGEESGTVHGGTGNDGLLLIYSNEGSSFSVYGDSGEDYLTGVGHNLTLDGGTGNDWIEGDDLVSSQVEGGSGNDWIEIEGFIYNTIHGGSGSDEITFDGNISSVYGDSGDDTIQGGGPRMTLDGGTGDDDMWVLADDSSLILGGNGNDKIIFWGADATVLGGSGDDEIYIASTGFSTFGPIYCSGDNGNDWVETDSSFQGTIDLGNGNDMVFIGVGEDLNVNAHTIIGGAGDDQMVLGSGNNTIQTGRDTDYIQMQNGAAAQDIFLFEKSGSNIGVTYIQGFEQGTDKLDLHLLGMSFDEVVILENAGDTEVLLQWASGRSIYVALDDVTGLTEGDFIT